jgi:integrase
MASGKFRIKTNNDWNTIYYRFKQGVQFDLELSTKIQVPKNRWSQSKQKILTTDKIKFREFNNQLEALDNYVRNEYEDSKIKSVTINSKWLKEKIAFSFNRETDNLEVNETLFFTSYIEKFIKASYKKKTRSNVPVSKKTIQHYTTTKNKVIAFEKFKSNRILLNSVNIDFHTEFIDFLRDEQYLNPNTIGGYVDDIKLFCSNASKKGLDIPNDYRLSEFYSPTNKTNDVYLNEEEINKIYNGKFEYDHLDNARDWFIIGLRTGFRVSDFLQLTINYIKDGYIEKTTKKGEFPVIIPFHNQVKEILKKRKGVFPRKISDQRFNDYIKKVCKEVGIKKIVEGSRMIGISVKNENEKEKIIHRKKLGKYPKYELVSSHVCRRSFATNLYGKIDTLTIMKITGHKTEKQFLDYIKITPKEYAEKLKEYWNKTTLDD